MCIARQSAVPPGAKDAGCPSHIGADAQGSDNSASRRWEARLVVGRRQWRLMSLYCLGVARASGKAAWSRNQHRGCDGRRKCPFPAVGRRTTMRARHPMCSRGSVDVVFKRGDVGALAVKGRRAVHGRGRVEQRMRIASDPRRRRGRRDGGQAATARTLPAAWMPKARALPVRSPHRSRASQHHIVDFEIAHKLMEGPGVASNKFTRGSTSCVSVYSLHARCNGLVPMFGGSCEVVRCRCVESLS